ncbi:hypothetical protein NC652_037327 [Populus alba x Populus x berolinensis]|nr:hypothetical protein NC652_037327 [Populus alba x Populus x berolinensis]
MSYCVPWARLMKRKGNDVMMKTPMMTSLMERQEKKRKEADIQSSELEKLVIRTSFAALNIATRSFDQDNVIGVGRMGTMYRAAHRYDLFTAVKRLHDSQPLGKQFRSELTILAKFRHMNIIPLLGFCVESGERLLVYKYMPNGNLHDWLHPVKCNAKKLDWHARVKIAIGVARGLAWLHDFNNFLIRKHKITDDDQAGSSPTAGLLEEGIKEISMLEKRVTRMSYADLKDATDNFSENNVIGEGKMGMLYKASLPNGYVLAVKKLHDSRFLEEQSISELKILGSLRHINVLPLLGFCVESNQRFLVYKYMPNGNLYDWLHPMEEGQEKAMEWGAMLITSMSNTPGVHDEFCEMALVKEDVHGFGVVLLELLTGMDCSRMNFSSNSILNEWIGHLWSTYFNDAMDRFLTGQGFDDEIFQLLKVACNCLDCIPVRRPTMLQVYTDIKAITKRCEVVDDSEIQMQPEICPATSQD